MNVVITWKGFRLLFAGVVLAGLLPLTTGAQPPAQIEPQLLTQLTAQGSADFFVKMATDADTSAGGTMDWTARGQYVWDSLKEVAKSTQASVLAYCQANGLSCTPMLINNSVFVRSGNLAAAQALAALPGVAYLRLERIYPLEPIFEGAGTPQRAAAGAAPAGVGPAQTLAWGIQDTHAPEFWATHGRGEGIKVANIDTGVQWNHPALDQAFACPGNPSSSSCWADPSNVCGGSACDNHGHGTHTMGTLVGDDDPALAWQVGMAPAATWIACKGCEDNYCSDYALLTCAGWILAPGGNPADRPHIVNNSWGGGSGDPWYLSSVQNWRNAGIFPAFSAGNEGPDCGTLSDPGDYQESFASTAHDGIRTAAWFASRGPSPFGDSPYTKPNISAPGVSICSSVPFDNWSCGFSGTSMASPHTAGAVALLWSCNPALVGAVATTFQALQDSADPPSAGYCGAPPGGQGNYTFGYGYLNVLALGAAYCAGGPRIAVSPSSLGASLCPDTAATKTLEICNVGAAELTWSVGESAAKGTLGVSVRFAPANGIDLPGGDAGMPDPVPWLGQNPAGGTVPAGGCVDVAIVFDSTGLAHGSYSADLVIDSNDPDRPRILLPVGLAVSDCRYVLLPLALRNH